MGGDDPNSSQQQSRTSEYIELNEQKRNENETKKVKKWFW